MTNASGVDTDVLIVGAGPVGLAAAIELAMRGVRVVLAERNMRVGNAPRAKTTNARTRAHLRRWGIADQLAAASPLGVDYPNDIHFVTSLAGKPLAKFPNAFNAAPARHDDYPEHAQWVPQYTLETVMLDRARELGVDVRFGVTLVDATQTDDAVTAALQHGDDTPAPITARYLIGADGARSKVRDLIGATMEGRYGLSRNSNIVFRAPGLAAAHDHGPGVMFVQIGPHGLSVTGPMDRGDVWYFMDAAHDEGPIDPADAQVRIARATGIDLPYEIISADRWVASELLADRYADRRLILAGDACHLHPPFGGYGMNMGVGDGVDLGWKIAAELNGWGGPDLVASYEPERRTVHRFVMDEAVVNHEMVVGSPWRDGLDTDTDDGIALRARIGGAIQASKGREYYTLGTVLGLGYSVSPIIAHEDTPAPPHDGQVYTPSARPGQLAPHGWLDDGRSLYDVFGPGFALVAGEEAAEREIAAAIAEAETLGVPLTVVRPGATIAARYEAPLALVRPDQHVAWRGARWDGALAMATGQRERIFA